MWHVWGEERCIQDFGGMTRGRRCLERLRLICEHIIKTVLQEEEWGNGLG